MTAEELPTDEWAEVRKLPVEVEARRVQEDTQIDTREGTVWAYPGDVIIRGAEGEVYPCGAEIFDETYELVDPGN